MDQGAQDTFRKLAAYLPAFVGFALRTFPLARLVLLLALVSMVLEFATLSLMLPLAGSGTSASGVGAQITSLWGSVAGLLGMPTEQQTWLWLFLLLLGLRTANAFLQMSLNFRVSKQIHAYLSDRIFRRVVSEEPLARIFRKTIGHYVSLAGDETFKAGNIFFYLGQLLSAGMSALVGLVILFGFSRPAFWATIAFLVLCGLLLARGMRSILRRSSTALVLSRTLNTNFIESLNGIRSIRSLSAENFVVSGYRKQIQDYVRSLRIIDTLNQAHKSVPALLLIGMGLVWLWPGTNGQPKEMTVFFFAVTTMLIRILTSLGEFVAAGGKLVADVRASQDAGALLAPDNSDTESAGLQALAGPVQSIVVESLSCGYEEGVPVLQDVSAEFIVGRSYAWVGKSGSGKSTLADVLLGFLPVSSGRIVVDGVPHSEIDRSSLRRRIVLVEQQTRIFSGTVRDNVTMGVGATDEEVLDALEAAGLKDFIAAQANGLAASMDYQGSNVSGGQRQRIGIARALLRQPDVLILDEGTSAVDPTMKRDLVVRLTNRFRHGIIIFVTHDAEVLSAVDEVWAVEEGRFRCVRRAGTTGDLVRHA